MAINSADDFINPPELNIMPEAIKKVPRGKFVLLPITDRRAATARIPYPPSGRAIWPGFSRSRNLRLVRPAALCSVSYR